MHGAGPDLVLLRSGAQLPAPVDVGRESLVVHEHAVAAQDVGHEVVGEDRQPLEVVEARDGGERQVRRRDLCALEETAIVEHRHAGGKLRGERLGRAAGAPQPEDNGHSLDPVTGRNPAGG